MLAIQPERRRAIIAKAFGAKTHRCLPALSTPFSGSKLTASGVQPTDTEAKKSAEKTNMAASARAAKGRSKSKNPKSTGAKLVKGKTTKAKPVKTKAAKAKPEKASATKASHR